MSTAYPRVNSHRTSISTRAVLHLLLLLPKWRLTKDIWGPLTRLCLSAKPSPRENWLISARS